MYKKQYDLSVCFNHEFHAGQRYKIKHGRAIREMIVDSVTDRSVSFTDVNDSRIRCSGEKRTVHVPCCQSCIIDGCDAVFSYDMIR